MLPLSPKEKRKEKGKLLLSHCAAYHTLFSRDSKEDYKERYNAAYVFCEKDIQQLCSIANEIPFKRHHITSVTIVSA